jgi:hypothetical protein
MTGVTSLTASCWSAAVQGGQMRMAVDAAHLLAADGIIDPMVGR